MYKILEFPDVDRTGNLFSEVIRRDQPLTKQAAADLHPDIAKFVGGLTSSPDCVYILVNALGAGEYYGANQNGDYFEESELNPSEWLNKPVSVDMTGYRSFYNANLFRNHRNQDPTQGFGKIVCAVYNQAMHRVELIVRVEKKLAEKFGHGDMYGRLEAGDRIATSMGTRVPYDVCSICGNKSKTKKDYCQHALTQMNEILPDGRKVFVYNPKPKFFDISIVVIGADRTSFAMSKVASLRGGGRLSAELGNEAGMEEPADRMRRLMKQAAATKRAEIEKDVPALSSAIMPHLTDDEPDLPDHLLDRIAGAADLGSALSGVTSTGVVLKPREFQRVILIRIGMPQMADQCASCGREIDPDSAGEDDSIDMPEAPQGVGGIVQALMPFLAARSGFSAPLSSRITVTKVASLRPARRVQLDNRDPLLCKIAAAYNGYRNQVMEKVANIVASTTARDVRLLSAVKGDLLEESLRVSHQVKIAAPDVAHKALLGAVPLAYLYGAHRGSQQKASAGAGQPNQSFLKKHPLVSLSVLVGLARLGHFAHKSGQLSELLARAAKHLNPEPEVSAQAAHRVQRHVTHR